MPSPVAQALLGQSAPSPYDDPSLWRQFPAPPLPDLQRRMGEPLSANLAEFGQQAAPMVAGALAGPAVGAAVRNPGVSAALAGGVGALMPGSTAGVAEEGPMQQLMTQQAQLNQRLNAAVAKREQQEASGKGPAWRAADAEVRQLQSELTAVNGMVAQQQEQNSPEHRIKMEKLAADQAAAEKTREAQTPFNERYPTAAGLLPSVAMGLAMGAPAIAGAKGNLGSFFPGSSAGRMRSTIQRGTEAHASGDPARQALAVRELDNQIAAQPTATSKVGQALASGASGGALAAEGRMYPDQYDARMLPPGPDKDAARERAFDPLNYIEPALFGTISGISGYKMGQNFTPRRTADVPRAQALADSMRGGPQGAAPAAPPRPEPTFDERVGRFRDPVTGNFVSAP